MLMANNDIVISSQKTEPDSIRCQLQMIICLPNKMNGLLGIVAGHLDDVTESIR